MFKIEEWKHGSRSIVVHRMVVADGSDNIYYSMPLMLLQESHISHRIGMCNKVIKELKV